MLVLRSQTNFCVTSGLHSQVFFIQANIQNQSLWQALLNFRSPPNKSLWQAPLNFKVFCHLLQTVQLECMRFSVDGNPQISDQNTALVRTWAQSCTFLSSQEWSQLLKNLPNSVCWRKNLTCVFQLLHLLVIWATLTLSEENCSSRSNSSREGGGISRKVGGKTCNTGHLNVAILLLAKPTTNSKEQYSIVVALSFQTNWRNQHFHAK